MHASDDTSIKITAAEPPNSAHPAYWLYQGSMVRR
jgi:hypothetical protein